jgi:hypothetical protein
MIDPNLRHCHAFSLAAASARVRPFFPFAISRIDRWNETTIVIEVRIPDCSAP